MSRAVSLTINGQLFELDLDYPKTITIKENDEIKIEITITPQDDKPEIFIEDYQPDLELYGENNLTYRTQCNRFFSESFGYSVLRIQFRDQDDAVNFPFDILARKTSADQAQKMIEYLSTHSEELIKCCFGRTSASVGAVLGDKTDPEMLISQAELFINTLKSSRQELLNVLKQRLVPVRLPFWEVDKYSSEIDPSDILNNLDALSPCTGIGDVFIQGRYFDVGSIDVSSLQPTADVLENRILLGGLYSIRLKISKLIDKLKNPIIDLERSDDYESFNNWMMRLTAGSMTHRCNSVLQITTELIKLFEHRLKIKYVGEIAPVLTPYSRSTRIYRSLFTQLVSWYALGQPSLGGLNFLMKLKSLSKIYELFVFFHLLDYLQQEGWNIIRAKPHQFMGEYLPSVVFLEKSGGNLTVEYERQINPFNKETQHRDLIDVYHKKNWSYAYYNPDFVLKLEVDRETRYLILDAKYSTSNTVRDNHIPRLFEKYYLGIAVYDRDLNLAVSNQIMGVIAIYSLDMRSNTYISYWSNQGIYSRLPRIPMVGGIGLMTENSDEFKNAMKTVLSLMEKGVSLTQTI